MAKKDLFTSDIYSLSQALVEKLLDLYYEGNLFDYLEENVRGVEFIIDIHGRYQGGRFLIPLDYINTFLIDELGEMKLISRDVPNPYGGLIPDNLFRETRKFLLDLFPLKKNIK